MDQLVPRGIRNNNPGNIRWGSKWQGLEKDGELKDPSFCVFKHPVYGIRALAKVLINYKKLHGLNTVKSIISRYAPPNENQTIAYIQSVCKQLNVHSTETIDVEERGILCILIKAIIRMENGCQPYSDETIIKGIDLI